MTLLDTNILLDVATRDPHWAIWSLRALEAASADGPLLINDVIFAEFSIRYAKVEDVEQFLDRLSVQLVPIPRQGLFAAGKAYGLYRSRGGAMTGVLPDFFIGAHAQFLAVPLLTRDAARYRTYFPDVELISPELS